MYPCSSLAYFFALLVAFAFAFALFTPAVSASATRLFAVVAYPSNWPFSFDLPLVKTSSDESNLMRGTVRNRNDEEIREGTDVNIPNVEGKFVVTSNQHQRETASFEDRSTREHEVIH